MDRSVRVYEGYLHLGTNAGRGRLPPLGHVPLAHFAISVAREEELHAAVPEHTGHLACSAQSELCGVNVVVVIAWHALQA